MVTRMVARKTVGGLAHRLQPSSVSEAAKVVLAFSSLPWASLSPRAYRLIDSLCQPHPQLDGLYDSVEEALRDAITWLEGLGPEASGAMIRLEVSTRAGLWRTIRLPATLLCPLVCPLPAGS